MVGVEVLDRERDEGYNYKAAKSRASLTIVHMPHRPTEANSRAPFISDKEEHTVAWEL